MNAAAALDMIRAQDEYIKELVAEANEIVTIAHARGWRSTRYEKGCALRERIEFAKQFIPELKGDA